MRLSIAQTIDVVEITAMGDKDQQYIRGWDTFTWTLLGSGYGEPTLARGTARTYQGALNEAQVWIDWIRDENPKVTEVQI